jgi:hypothetical protein
MSHELQYRAFGAATTALQKHTLVRFQTKHTNGDRITGPEV